MEETLRVNYVIALSLKLHVSALRLAIRLDDSEKITEVFADCSDRLVKKQLCYLAARQRIVIPDQGDEEFNRIASNSYLTEFYNRLAKELDVLEPKKPEQVYKSLSDDSKANVESLSANLADTYVNAFVNMGCKKDTLMIKQVTATDKPWIFNLKKSAIAAATASIGLIDIWDPSSGK